MPIKNPGNASYRLFTPFFLIVGLGSCVPVSPQTEPNAPLKLRTRIVQVDAVVRNKRGLPIDHLDRGDFEIRDDGRLRTINYFSDAGGTRPLSIVLLFDLRPTGAGRFFRAPEIPVSLAKALSKLRPIDEVAIVATFVGGDGFNRKEVIGFTRDRESVSAALKTLPDLVGPYTTTAIESLSRAIPELVSNLFSTRPESDRVLICISDGFNGMMNGDRDRHLRTLLRADVTVGALICGKTAWVKTGTITLAPLLAATGTTANVLDHFAKQTGGPIYKVRKPEDYATALEKIIDDLTARYTLGFELGENEPDDGKVHRLEVMVTEAAQKRSRQKLHVLARRSYYLPPTQSQATDQHILTGRTEQSTTQSKRSDVEQLERSNSGTGPTETPDRIEDQETIRRAASDLSAAEARGDIETIKRLMSGRTLGLIRLWFDLIVKRMPQRNDVPNPTNGDELFSMVLGAIGGARRPDAASAESQALSPAAAQCKVVFVDRLTAKVECPGQNTRRAVFEDGIWKLDDTENLKREILQMELLTAEDKQRIRNY